MAMSNQALRNRLRRLEQFVGKAHAVSDPVCDQFEIDLDLARQIRDDDWRAYQLSRKVFKMRLTAAEHEERSKIRQRVIEKARGIVVPPGYGMSQSNRDADRNRLLFRKRLKFPYRKLPPAEDVENAVLTARLKAFHQSPEAIASGRINNLQRRLKLPPPEAEELQQLVLKYPPLPWPDCELISDLIEETHRAADQAARSRKEIP